MSTTHVRIDSGVCGFACTVEAACADGQHVRLRITSECPHVAELAEKFCDRGIDILDAITPGYVASLCDALPHPSCPVPVGICKAIEAAGGLALPHDAHITFLNPSVETDDGS